MFMLTMASIVLGIGFAIGLYFVTKGIFCIRHPCLGSSLFCLSFGALQISLFAVLSFLFIPDLSGFTAYRKFPVTTQVTVDKDADGNAIHAYSYDVSFDLIENYGRNLFTKKWRDETDPYFSIKNLKVTLPWNEDDSLSKSTDFTAPVFDTSAFKNFSAGE